MRRVVRHRSVWSRAQCILAQASSQSSVLFSSNHHMGGIEALHGLCLLRPPMKPSLYVASALLSWSAWCG
jgi:hypothetical protein